jgi:arylsulfatase A-like enzyme
MPQLPNILILLIDTARAQNLSCYGYSRPTSPHIDAVAAEGVLYEQAIAPGCWSLPSQMSLLTGMFPAKHGAHELHLFYDHSYPLLPEVLQQEGYHTLGVSPNSWMSDEFGVTHGFDTYLQLWQCWPTMPAGVPPVPNGLFSTVMQRLNRLYSRHVFPRRNRAGHVRQHIDTLLTRTPEPFFLYAIFWDMHLPYTPTQRHATRWLPAGITLDQAKRINRNHLRYFAEQVPMSAEDFTILRACYDAALASIDEEIGVLVAHLRQRGILDHTILVITSDHGENIGEHGLMSHAYSLHDTLIRVPLIIRYPDCFTPGQRVTQQVQLTDVFPTLVDLLQLEVPNLRQELQGVSLLAQPAEERLAYAEMLAPHPSMQSLNRRVGAPAHTPRPAFDRALRCLRTPACKIIWSSDGQHALYNLRQDAGETTNRFADEPALASTLLELLDSWHPPHSIPLPQPAPDIDTEVRQRLRDLGYLD